jgi:zinc transport system substrate-binding protein
VEQSKKAKLIAILAIVLLVAALTVSATYFKRKTWADDKIRVVTTILPLADFVEQVGGNKVEVITMIAPGDSPHTVDFAPSKLEMLSQADVYVKVGTSVDFELALMGDFEALNPDMPVIDCSDGIMLLDGEGDQHDDEHGGDPHIWLSPINAKTIIENISDRLIAIDPENTAFYTQNTNDYLDQLDELDEYIEETLSEKTNRNIMIYHPSFGYFSNEYDLNQHAIEIGGSEATAKTLESSIRLARLYDLNYVFVSPQSEKDRDNAQLIAAETGGQIVKIDPLPVNYILNMRAIANAIAQELK